MKSKNIAKKLVASIIFAFVVMLVMIYLVGPFAQRQYLKFGANIQIKSESRCDGYKSQFVELMMKKEIMTNFMEIVKQDKCLK